MGSEQVAKYLSKYGLVVFTNLRQFVIIAKGAGPAHATETFTIANSKESFWNAVGNPRNSNRVAKRKRQPRARAAFEVFSTQFATCIETMRGTFSQGVHTLVTGNRLVQVKSDAAQFGLQYDQFFTPSNITKKDVAPSTPRPFVKRGGVPSRLILEANKFHAKACRYERDRREAAGT